MSRYLTCPLQTFLGSFQKVPENNTSSPHVFLMGPLGLLTSHFQLLMKVIIFFGVFADSLVASRGG